MAPLTVASVHLGLTVDERARHSELIVGLLRGTPRLIVTGDLNEPPGGPSWRALEPLGRDTGTSDSPATYPAAAPTLRLDAVLAGGDVQVTEPEWLPDAGDVLLGSDHRPVLRIIS
jgi:endonuclease/exonuclease/phosphatase family metal-dependent hydrolase